jgi:hypothetical protein
MSRARVATTRIVVEEALATPQLPPIPADVPVHRADEPYEGGQYSSAIAPRASKQASSRGMGLRLHQATPPGLLVSRRRFGLRLRVTIGPPVTALDPPTRGSPCRMVKVVVVRSVPDEDIPAATARTGVPSARTRGTSRSTDGTFATATGQSTKLESEVGEAALAPGAALSPTTV